MNKRRIRWSCYALIAALVIPASVSRTAGSRRRRRKKRRSPGRCGRRSPAISQNATIVDVGWDGVASRHQWVDLYARPLGRGHVFPCATTRCG